MISNLNNKHFVDFCARGKRGFENIAKLYGMGNMLGLKFLLSVKFAV
jgi:hypothetical protein